MSASSRVVAVSRIISAARFPLGDPAPWIGPHRDRDRPHADRPRLSIPSDKDRWKTRPRIARRVRVQSGRMPLLRSQKKDSAH
jgi:hypothetical protein